MGILTQNFERIEVTDDLLISDGYRLRPVPVQCTPGKTYWDVYCKHVFMKPFDYFLDHGRMWITYDADLKTMLITYDGFSPIINTSEEYKNILNTKIDDWGDLKVAEDKLLSQFALTIQHL